MYFVLMGVSGSGKSTFARRISKAHDLPFFEADDFHPTPNIEKMRSGLPLDDKDRELWLKKLTDAVQCNPRTCGVIACSALTPFVQTFLEQNLPTPPIYILMEVSEELTRARLKARRNHFMPASLLTSQFEALCIPASAYRVPNDTDEDSVYQLLEDIIQACLCRSQDEGQS